MKHRFFLIAVISLGCLHFTALAQEEAVKVLDKRDLVVSEWITDLQTNVRFLDHETIYDSQGRKVQETEYARTGKLWTKKYEYGPDGRVERELTYNDRGRLDSIRKYEYNEFGKKKAVHTYDSRGHIVKTKVMEYKYREHVSK